MDEVGGGFGWRESGGSATCKPIHQPVEDYAAKPWAQNVGRGAETGLVKTPCTLQGAGCFWLNKKGENSPRVSPHCNEDLASTGA